MKLYGRRMRRDKSNHSDHDLAPRSLNRIFRRIQRKREDRALQRKWRTGEEEDA